MSQRDELMKEFDHSVGKKGDDSSGCGRGSFPRSLVRTLSGTVDRRGRSVVSVALRKSGTRGATEREC